MTDALLHYIDTDGDSFETSLADFLCGNEGDEWVCTEAARLGVGESYDFGFVRVERVR